MKGFVIGEVLKGFCNGYFGRDSYEDKRVEAFGKDWVVCRDKEGHVHFATFDENSPYFVVLPPTKPEHTITFWEMVDKWRKGEN